MGMPKILKLQAKRNLIRADLKTFLDLAEGQEADMSPEQEATFDRLQAELKDIDAKIDLQERQDAWEMNQPAIYESGSPFMVGGERPFGGPVRLYAPRSGKPWKAAELFGRPSASAFRNLDGFLDPIVQGTFHEQLVPALASQEGTGSAGGYAVPIQYSQAWLDSIIENSAVLGRCTIVPMTSNTMVIPGFDASSHANGELLGGVSGGWIPESGGIDYETPRYRRVKLEARKLAVLTACSSEVLQDGISFAAQLESNLTRGMRWMVDRALIAGSGAGQPLGLLNDPAKIRVDQATSQDAGTIVFENVADMLGRLHPSCWERAVWLCNPSCVPQLVQLAIPVGLGGQWVTVLQESSGKFSLLGREVVFSEKCSAVGTEGDIILADLSQYCVGLRQEITIERSAHVRFANDEVVFRGITRLDGQGLWGSAFTPLNGPTQSWCVTLETRG